MKNMKKVPWHIIISAMILTMLVLATSKVFAHGEGRCFTSASRNTFLRNGSFMKVVDHLSDTELKELQGGGYKHGHRHQYYDRNGNETTPSTAFFDIDFDDNDGEFYVDCPTVSPPFTRSPRNPVNGCDPEPTIRVSQHRDVNCSYLAYPRDLLTCHEWDFELTHYAGIPILPDGVETLSEFRSHLYETTGHKVDIRLLVDGIGIWDVFPGPNGIELGQTIITPHLGINVSSRDIIAIVGNSVLGQEITLTVPDGKTVGVHFIGFPEVPANYERFSDLLVDGVDRVDRRVRVDGKLHYQYIRNPGDTGDDMIRAGDAVVVRVREDVTLNLRGSVMSAPSVRRKGTLATSWGAMKR